MANPNLIKQIEYYLSEENLQNDEFFYKEVASNPYIYSYPVNTSLRLTFSWNATKLKNWEWQTASR